MPPCLQTSLIVLSELVQERELLQANGRTGLPGILWFLSSLPALSDTSPGPVPSTPSSLTADGISEGGLQGPALDLLYPHRQRRPMCCVPSAAICYPAVAWFTRWPQWSGPEAKGVRAHGGIENRTGTQGVLVLLRHTLPCCNFPGCQMEIKPGNQKRGVTCISPSRLLPTF